MTGTGFASPKVGALIFEQLQNNPLSRLTVDPEALKVCRESWLWCKAVELACRKEPAEA